MNHAANSTVVADASVDACSFLRTTATLAVVSVILAPIAAWQFGVAGAGLVAAFAVVMAATVWSANRIEARFARQGQTVAGLLAASGVRMAVPLIAAVVFVLVGGRFVPVSSVLLLVPLYLSTLVMDTMYHVRHQTQHTDVDSPWLPPAGSARRGQG